jgi:hypothetical protein
MLWIILSFLYIIFFYLARYQEVYEQAQTNTAT